MAKSKKKEQESKKISFTPYYIAIFILSFVFYGNSLKNEYSMDDSLVTSTYDSKHPTVEGGIKSIPKIFTSHFVVNSKQSYAYRPVTTTSFAIEYQVFGQNPTVSHFFNILLYALAIIVLFRLLNQIWGEEKYILTVLTCLFFLIHPIHTEVVNNIKSRDELLSFLFGVLAIKQALNYFDLKKIKYIFYAVSFILLSLLSKKTGMIFVAILPLTLYYFRKLNLKRIGIIIGSVLIGLLIAKVMGKALLEDSVSRVKYYFENPLYYAEFKDRIPMYFYSNYYYLALMILPYPLRYYYGFDQVSIADWSNPIVYLMLIIMVASVGITLWRIKKKEIWGFGILFYFLAIGGACNLLFPAVGIIAERFAFIASLGFSIIVGYGIYYFFFQNNAKFASNKNIVKYGLIAASIVSLIYVFNRNQNWKTDFSLYQHDISCLEKSYKAHNLLGQEYYKQSLKAQRSNLPPVNYMSKVDSAELEFKKCVSLYDGYAITYNNLGALYHTFRKEEDTAYSYFQLAIAIDSNYSEALYNLGNIELNKYYTYHYLQMYSSQLIDSIHPPSSVEDIVAHKSKLTDIGRTLKEINFGIPLVISAAGNKSQTQQDFLIQLQTNVVGLLKSMNILEWFDQESFNQKLLTNGPGIIQSYENGYLNQHLFNFIAYNLTKSWLNSEDLSNLNSSSIAEWSLEKENSFYELFMKHLNKCIDLAPGYYPPYQNLNQFYFDQKDYNMIIELNEKMINGGGFKYNHEFYNNIAKAYYFLNDMTSCKTYLETTIAEIDKYINSGDNSMGNLGQLRQSVVSQLTQVNQLLGNTSN